MSTALLTVESISRRFGGIRAVDNASFDVQEGSITGLIGPNGAGKTTAFNLISGFLKVHGGAVTFDGQRVERRQSHAIARAGLVRTFQIPRVLTRMTVIENMMWRQPLSRARC
jgi:ABC-type branched-subunit amino acid transport system ATPase component